jgi:D-3-phosphoglycerate dehydrogenase
MSEGEKIKNFIIDFDSTFTQVEALDILGEIALKDSPEKAGALRKIKEITDQGMEGKLSFRESLDQRLAILQANKSHIEPLINQLRQKVTKSFVRNADFLRNYKDHIYIVSNGFKEFICPIVTEFGIDQDHVFANTFIYDNDDNIIGFDEENVLSANEGKAAQIEALQLQGEVHVIGDGHTDYEIKSAGKAHKFFAFTENVARESVKIKADHVTPSLDEFLYLNKMNTVLSYPKNRIKVLLLEGIHEDAAVLMRDEGYEVELIASGMDEDELCERIKDISLLGIRSKTQVTKKVLEHARRLHAIGAFCIGTNQIDLVTCQEKGIAVFNAPYSNTRSVVEMAIAEIIFLMRNLPDKMIGMHQGKWLKSAVGSYEIRNKKLGIIGYGNIGTQLSVLAESIGMQIYYYDLEEKLGLGNATKCNSMAELLGKVDVVSLHVDGRPTNVNLIGEQQFSQMKEGAILINLGRGKVVDIDALKTNLDSGKLKGAAVDVFPVEPKNNQEPFESALKGSPNTILTPHIGGSTVEAQINIASYVPETLVNFINTGNTAPSVNFPKLQLPILENGHRLIHIHRNEPGMLAKIDKILADHKINIIGQYLKTNEILGYVITDINKEYPKTIIKELKAIEGTIRVRVLY